MDRGGADFGRSDADDLRQFGYAQELVRQIGGFSSFALAFSLISVFTGVFANFGHGLRQVGGAVVWSWLIVLVGQTLVALVLADLSSRMPLSGYGYQWTSRLVSPHAGFFIGWLLGLQFLCGFPGICATLAAELGRMLGGGWTSSTAVTAVTLAIIAVVALIHLCGIRLAAMINDVGVWTELVGVVAATGAFIFLAVVRAADPAVLVSTVTSPGAGPAGIGGWALSLLLGAWCLTGFEAAADLAEETRQPRRIVPRAMLTSLGAAGLLGGLLIAGVVLIAPDLDAARADSRPLATIVEAAVGRSGWSAMLSVGGVSIFACALASMAAASRLLYAMARDRMLPGSTLLAAVEPGTHSPRNAILFIWLLSSAVVLALPTLDVITQISAVAGYVGYAGIVAAALWAPAAPVADGFTLGRLRVPVAGLALTWTLLVVAALTVPPLPLEGIATRHLPAISSATGLALGAAIYLICIRPRILAGTAGPPPETRTLR
ncbi:MAG: amino acid permease [Planctomycetes bacterium]|nr:amino acid permease [Planctomycetota bacterium]